MFEKEKQKTQIRFYFFKAIMITHRNLQCLFMCFYVCLNPIPPLLLTPYLLKKHQMNAKGHFQNSSELPKEESSPSHRFLQLPGRQREGDAAALCASLSFLSNGLEMYYYANVNFDTEFKKRLLDFFFHFLKKRSHMWSSLLLYFVM